MRRTRLILIAVLCTLAVTFLALSWQNSLAVTSVSIRLKEGQREKTDHSVPGLGSEHRLPDYKVKVRVNRRLLAIDLGTRLNTSATNWLKFAINDLIPARHLQEVIIVEDDTVENDVVDRIQGSGLERDGALFQCRLTTKRDFEVGMNWFFSTPVGKSITATFIIVLLLLAARFLRVPLS